LRETAYYWRDWCETRTLAAAVAQTEQEFRALIAASQDDPDYKRAKAELAAPGGDAVLREALEKRLKMAHWTTLGEVKAWVEKMIAVGSEKAGVWVRGLSWGGSALNAREEDETLLSALARPAAAETTGLLSTLERLKQNFLDCSRQHEDALVVQQYAAQKLDAKSVSHGFKRAAEKIDTLLASNTGEAAKQLLGALYMVKLMKAASHALRSYEIGNSDPTIAKTVADQIDAALAEPREGGKT
jgi:hypothetical protein